MHKLVTITTDHAHPSSSRTSLCTAITLVYRRLAASHWHRGLCTEYFAQPQHQGNGKQVCRMLCSALVADTDQPICAEPPSVHAQHAAAAIPLTAITSRSPTQACATHRAGCHCTHSSKPTLVHHLTYPLHSTPPHTTHAAKRDAPIHKLCWTIPSHINTMGTQR